MELVDANTKNYVFMTLSQYNDKQKLVRTRVSMRRDQPFWDGGNSYICCESFRVTSSPNQGGLYYKIFQPEWYMGCSIARDDQSELPEPQDWQPLSLPFVNNTPDHRGKGCSAALVQYDRENEVSQALIYTRNVNADGTSGDFNTADPTLIQTYLAKWCNHYHLTKGAWTQFLSYDTGANNVNRGWYAGRLMANPSTRISGNGFGPSRMYYPRLALNANTIDGPLAQLNHVATNGDSIIQMQFLLKPQPQLPEDSQVTDAEVDIFTKALGAGMQIQLRTKAEQPYLWDLPIYGGCFELMGIQGVKYNFQNRFFNGAVHDEVMAVQTGPPLRPMYFSEFKVGNACWVDIAEGDPLFTRGKYFGTITEVPATSTQAGYVAYPMHLRATPALFLHLQQNIHTVDARTRFLEQDFMATYDGTPVSRGITANTEFQVRESHNLGPVDPPPPEGNDPQEPSFWDFTDASVLYVSNPHADEMMCIRKPAEDGPKYMYTPNEMFFAFNKPEHNIGALPYKLQTDENGGFVIRWNDTNINPGTNFIISCALSQELGLNEYFEYNSETYLDHFQEDKFFLLKDSRQPWMPDQQITTWINRHDLSTTNPVWSPDNEAPAWTPAPMMPVQNGALGAGPSLWDRQGQKYAYISNHQFSRDRFENDTTRIYPVVHTDADGVEYFSYNDLPTVGRIGNTQMVSVESFSTYSEITIVIPNLPFQSMLGTSSDERILASLRLPFDFGTGNDITGEVTNTTFSYYGDLIFNTLASRSYLKVTTDQQLYDCDCEVRLIRRDGQMDVMQLPYKGEFQVKIRMLQTQ